MTARESAAHASFVLAALSLASLAHGNTTPTTAAENFRRVQGIQSRFVVESNSTRIDEDRGSVRLMPAPSYLPVYAAGLLWSQPDNGEGWVGRAVTLASRGTQVFTEFDTAADRAELVSSFDQVPIAPVWNDPQSFNSSNVFVQGADLAARFVSCRQWPIGTTGSRNVSISAYSSNSGSPSWTWNYPAPTNVLSRIGISRDGNRIVAGSLNNASLALEIAVFDNGASTPTAFYSHVIGPQLRAFVLSADGTTLYFASGTNAFVMDMSNGNVLHSHVLMTSLDCQDMSGDGRVIANGGFGVMDVWERQGDGSYQRTHQQFFPANTVVDRIAVSEDGSTIAYGINWFDLNLRIRVEALDVASKTLTMSDEAMGGGTYQNIVSDIAISRDGSHFAVGLWGDQADLVPELRLYRREVSAPVATYNYPGSVYDLAMNPNGDRIVVGTKSVHANVLAGGGTVDLYSFSNEDFIAHGVPSVGRKVDFELAGAPNKPARLLVSDGLAASPTTFPTYGTLFLKRQSLYSLSMGSTDASGTASKQYQLTSDPAMIGHTLYFQGMTANPRRFTRNWVPVTILP